MKKALITGINGQDGKYLRELLLEKEYEVFGVSSQISDADCVKLDSEKIKMFVGDICDYEFMQRVILDIHPDEIYNLAAQSSVGMSYDGYVKTEEVNSLAVIQMLEVLRKNEIKCKFFQASSSEIFGLSHKNIINEETKYNPHNPYGISKLSAHLFVKNFRTWNNTYAVNGILFAHESPMRPEKFVTRKITKGIAEIIEGKRSSITLGNIHIKKDWGYAGDYVEAMWLMLQQGEPEDFIISSGESHSIKEFLEIAFSHVGLDWEKYIVIDSSLFRPIEYEELIGNNSKAKDRLNWLPKVKFTDLVKMMVDYDIKLLNT